MTYVTGDRTTWPLPELPAGMRWVVLVDKRQIAVMLLENEMPVASATECWSATLNLTTNTSPLMWWDACAWGWLLRCHINGVSVRCLAAPGVLSAQRLVTADRCDCSTRCGESPSATKRFAVKPANTGSTAQPLVP
jgi:hypothetical protein